MLESDFFVVGKNLVSFTSLVVVMSFAILPTLVRKLISLAIQEYSMLFEGNWVFANRLPLCLRYACVLAPSEGGRFSMLVFCFFFIDFLLKKLAIIYYLI